MSEMISFHAMII